MITRSILAWLSLRSLRFAADRRGSSAIEFALLLPLMLIMYFGSIQITDAISADRQVTLVASTVAEITSQYATVSSTDVSNILAAASAVLTPFPVANARVTLSSVLIDANGNATIDWSATLNGTQRSRHQFDTGRIAGSQYVGDLGRGHLQLPARDRLGHHRNDCDVRSDLPAAPPVQQRRAQLTPVESRRTGLTTAAMPWST
jgi:Flp pilus assembly protein TadG